MTRYSVQVKRSYEIVAEDEEHAVELAIDKDGAAERPEAYFIVTEVRPPRRADQPSGDA